MSLAFSANIVFRNICQSMNSGLELFFARLMPDRRGLEDAVERSARKFPDCRIELVYRFLILEIVSRYGLEALPSSC